MTRRNGFKRVIFAALALVFMLSLMSISINADSTDSKVVTVVKSGSTVATYIQIDSLINQYRQTTINYDDGAYTGVLAFSNITNVKNNGTVPVPSPSGSTYYSYTYDIVYTGAVTKYITTDTKTVEVVKSGSTAASYLSYATVYGQYANTTVDYDDGTYKGKLTLLRVTNIVQNEKLPIPYSSFTHYRYTFDLVYSGTVTRYR